MSGERRRQRLILESRILVGVCYAAVFFSYACPFPLRHDSIAVTVILLTAFMIRVFLFHIGLGVAGLLVASVLLKQWRLAGATVPLMLFIMLPECRNLFMRDTAPAPGSLKVSTVNLFEHNVLTDKALSVIREFNPDVLLLQEYTTEWHSRIGDVLQKSFAYRRIDPQPDPYGSAIFSRIPLGENEKPQFVSLGHDAPPQMKATVQFASTAISLYHIHLLTPAGIAQFREQCRQVADLVDLVRQEAGPVILAGDFNFNERTQLARALRKCGFQNAYDKAGRLRGSTWPSVTFLRYFPGVRLDHVLVRGLAPVGAKLGPRFGSDHRPIFTALKLRQITETR